LPPTAARQQLLGHLKVESQSVANDRTCLDDLKIRLNLPINFHLHPCSAHPLSYPPHSEEYAPDSSARTPGSSSPTAICGPRTSSPGDASARTVDASAS